MFVYIAIYGEVFPCGFLSEKMEPISIAWRNLNFYKTSFFDLKHFGRRQAILRDLYGSFHVHSLNGVLGCSGSVS